MANPFRKILQLSAGDLVGKTLYFLAFVYLARTLDVADYGLLEFAGAILAYFLLLSDAGLETWAVREVAQSGNVRELAGQVTGLRLMLAAAAFGLLLAALPFIPPQGGLHLLLVLFGLGLFTQALSLKWVFVGEQRMKRVAAGLVLAQVVFAGLVFAFVGSPAQLTWVPVLKVASELALAGYFGWHFAREHGFTWPRVAWHRAAQILRPALTLAASTALSMINYNFDSVVLGLLAGSVAVGWYGAAYKPVTVALAMPMTYFTGLYPVLATTFARDRDAFGRTLTQSIRISAVLAVPLAVGGMMLAAPIINLLFGAAYTPSIPVLKLLVWSASLVILRGTFSYALMVADHGPALLRCALASATVNVVLNLILIPRYGMNGAAIATIVAELVWLVAVVDRVNRLVVRTELPACLFRPVLAGVAMGATLWAAEPIPWIARAVLSVLVYFAVLRLLIGRQWAEWRL